MKLWSDFYDLAVPELPGCPLAAIDSALRQSAIAFCEQSLAWQAAHPEVPVLPGIAEYAFAPPAEAVVHAVTWAALDGEEIASNAGRLNITGKNWRSRTGRPEQVLGGTTSLTLVPKPGAAGTLNLEVALKPTPDATGVPDDIFNECRETIVHGALARLMLSPRKPYGNAQLAAYHQQQFLVKTAAAGTRVSRSYTRASLRTSIMARR